MFRLNSIRKRIFVLVFVVVLMGFGVIVTGGMVYMANLHTDIKEGSARLGKTAADDSREALEKKAEEQLAQTAGAIADITDEKLKEIRNQTEIIAGQAEYIYAHPEQYSKITSSVDYLAEEEVGEFALHIKTAEGVTKDSIQEELNLISNISDLLCRESLSNPSINACYIGSASGFQLSADKDPQGPGNKSYPVTEREWYRGAAEAQGVYWTDVFTDVSAQRESINCSVPYYVSGPEGERTLKGVAVSAATLSQIQNIIDDSGVGDTGYSFIVDKSGDIIISHQGMNVREGKEDFGNLLESEDARMRGMAEKMISGETGAGQAALGGKEMYISYDPLQMVPWTMVTVMETREVQASAEGIESTINEITQDAVKSLSNNFNRVFTALFILSAVAILVVAGLSFRLSGRITGPVNRLTQSVKLVSEGNLEAQVLTENTGDEIQTLSEAFSKMTIDLRTYIANIQAITAEKERVGAELNIAKRIQASMLPCIFPPYPDRREFDIYATMQPAKEVGGDFYDFFLVDDDHLGIVIADVSGKGVPAALFMVITKTLIKNHAQLGETPEKIFHNVNVQLCENNEAQMFVTAWMGILQISTGKFTYVNAGHNPPLLKRCDGEFEYLRQRPAFVLAGMERVRYRQAEMELKTGDMLYLYTDGVTEAMDINEGFYGEERLKKVLEGRAKEPLEQLLKGVKSDIDAFVKEAPQFDDITMLALKINGEEEQDMRSLTVPAVHEKLEDVLEFVERELAGGQCPSKALMQIKLAVEEIYINIVKYAYPSKGGEVTVRLGAEGDTGCVCIEFSDHGKPYNPIEKEDPDVTLSLKEREVGGLGVFLVKKSVDDIEYEYRDGMNILTIRKRL